MPTNRDEAAARIKELTRKVEYHSRLYYQLDSPEISDYDYDMLFRELTELEQKYPELADPNSPTKRVGGKAADRLRAGCAHRTAAKPYRRVQLR